MQLVPAANQIVHHRHVPCSDWWRIVYGSILVMIFVICPFTTRTCVSVHGTSVWSRPRSVEEGRRNEQFKCKESKQQICPQRWRSHLWWELHQQIPSRTFLLQVRPPSSGAAGGPGCIPITVFLEAESAASVNPTLLLNQSQVIAQFNGR